MNLPEPQVWREVWLAHWLVGCLPSPRGHRPLAPILRRWRANSTMGSAWSADDDDDGDALSRAMDPANFKSPKELGRDLRRSAFEEAQSRAQGHWVKQVASLIADDEKLVRLTYTSRLCLEAGSGPARNTIANICTIAMHNNRFLRVGGVLSFDESTSSVVQELEGPETAVRHLFAKIERDPRHMSVHIVHDDIIAPGTRRHQSFGMRFDSESNGKTAHSSELSGDCLRLSYASLLCAKGHAALALTSTIVRSAVTNNQRKQIGGVLFLNLESLPQPLVIQVPTSPT